MLNMRFLFCSLLLLTLMACGGDDNSGNNNNGDDGAVFGSLGEERSLSVTVTPDEGGELTLEADNGDILTLAVPAYALDEETEITVTWLAEAPDTQLEDLLFALRFEPDGLIFNKPAHLSIEHDESYDEADDVTLFWIVSSEQSMAVTVDPITDTTDVYLSHFSDYGGAKADPNMDISCMDANWLDPASTCLQDVPMIKGLIKCAAQASKDNAPESEISEYLDLASNLLVDSFKIMRNSSIPEDDYCHRDGSKSGQYINDLITCINLPGIGDPGFMSEEDHKTIQTGIEEAATELAQAWLDSDPPSGDSCYKLGEVEEWMSYAACLVASPLHSIEADGQFSDHLTEGKIAVQKEFLATTEPSQHDELCGWYLDCLQTHMSDLELTRSFSSDGEITAQDIERRTNETEAQCLNLWDVKIEIDVTNNFIMSGMQESNADFTFTVDFEDVAIEAEREDMQTAMQSVNELGGIKPGMKSTEGDSLELPFFTNLESGGQFIQMSFLLELKDAKSWKIVDNGSTYTCHMEWGCGQYGDYEVHQTESGSSMGSPSGQIMMMRSRANKDLNWAGYTLPANRGYLIWRFDYLVEFCKFDNDEGEWECERPTLGLRADPHSDESDVVNHSLTPDHHYFNAHLTPQQVKNVLDRKGFSYSYSLNNHVDINDGASIDDWTQDVSVTLTPKK